MTDTPTPSTSDSLQLPGPSPAQMRLMLCVGAGQVRRLDQHTLCHTPAGFAYVTDDIAALNTLGWVEPDPDSVLWQLTPTGWEALHSYRPDLHQQEGTPR